MAYVELNANNVLGSLLWGINGLRITGAAYDAATDTLRLHVSGPGIADFGELVPVQYRVAMSVHMPCTKLMPKDLAPAPDGFGVREEREGH